MVAWGADGRFHPLTEQIIAAAIEVYRALGPGLLESTYEECLDWELRERKYKVARCTARLQTKTARFDLPPRFAGRRQGCRRGKGSGQARSDS